MCSKSYVITLNSFPTSQFMGKLELEVPICNAKFKAHGDNI